MIRDRSVRRTSYYWAPRFTAIAVVMLPFSLQKNDFRAAFGSGLTVSANKNSPAYAAFEDIHQNYTSHPSPIPATQELLSAGTRFEHRPEMSTVRKLALKGMTVRSVAAALPQPIYVAGESGNKVSPAMPQPLEVQTVIQNEALPVPVSEVRREIRSITGNKIIIAKADLRPDPVMATGPAPASYALAPGIRRREEADPAAAFVPGMTGISPVAGHNRPLWLNGQIEMTGGLAFLGAAESSIVVKRVVDGQVVEKGRIWVNEGRFEIFVKTVSGRLVAELLGRDGRVLGRGEMNLVHIKDIPTDDNRIYDLRIALRPTTETASLRTVSGYSHGQKVIPVREARVEIQNYGNAQKVTDEGYFSEPTLTSHSSYVARAAAPKHWATVVVGQAHRPQDVRLFSERLMAALIGLEMHNRSDRKEARLASVVWGQVRRDGKAAENVVVEMAGNYSPVYLNEYYLPDPALKATSKNGLFAFVNVRRGVQALRATAAGRTYPAQVFPTEERHVSYVEVELEDRLVSNFKVIDVLNMANPVEARIRMVGAEDYISVKGEGLVQYSKGADPFMVEAEAGPEYEISRITLTGKPQTVHVPMIRRDWLAGLFNKNNVLALPGRGMVVGFVDDQDFEVELTGYGLNERMQVVYFDARGNQVESRHGMAGGGFVIFNAPLGLQTLYVHPKNGKHTYAQVVVAEPEFVHVMSWSPGAD